MTVLFGVKHTQEEDHIHTLEHNGQPLPLSTNYYHM